MNLPQAPKEGALRLSYQLAHMGGWGRGRARLKSYLKLDIKKWNHFITKKKIITVLEVLVLITPNIY